ncbi:LCP family protein [Streptomyces katsurahamanus]|uniref:LytR family transcriptional regulator n=1 Tax=Streptomyces katsurahamanus TaxID=2577098 RepID=A0ABW9NS34_9ACTN|nr:LCP family protein [Streptomyces katsurahamanus]MQS35679.1 LytR family transcriptional regulator [Streptomyces katsurahamanus]
MNDQHNPYDPYFQQPRIIGYDEYGQPVYEQPQQYDPYAQQQTHQPQEPVSGQVYGYDSYAQQQQQPPQQYGQPQQYDSYAPHEGYDGGYGYAGAGQPAAVDTAQQWNIPQQQQPPQQQQQQQPQPQRQVGSDAESSVPGSAHGHVPADVNSANGANGANGADPGANGVGPGAAVPGQRRSDAERDYRTEQFSFIEEPDEDSEDVIDWLKFTESRSERREEAKRRGRNRIVALAVVLALALAGGIGYLWFTGDSDQEKTGTTATGPQKRDVIVLHLHNTKKKGTSTALLVDNATTRRGATVLLPNALSVANDDGTVTTLGKSVEDDGSDGTREAIGTLFGAKITGTWRLDTPFLENLVELVGSIELTTDATVPGPKEGDGPLVEKGENQTLNGRAAVAYATHRGPGEAEAEQLNRFGQVMQAVLKKIPSDAESATVTVETLAQILDPSLTESDLGASLAKLSERAKGGDYKTTLLPVQQDGTLTEQASSAVVKDVLGGSVSAPDKDAAVRVGIRNATGGATATETARVSLVNGGYSVVDSGKADAAAVSRITYGDEARKAEAVEVAKTLGLPTSAVEKGAGAANADISVILGQDFTTG